MIQSPRRGLWFDFIFLPQLKLRAIVSRCGAAFHCANRAKNFPRWHNICAKTSSAGKSP
jgi:hypothetical protein